jgi:hypothetical protein
MPTTLDYRYCSRPALLLVALFSMSACTAETGIVIEVSHAGLAVAPDTLRFFIGVQRDDVPIYVPECGDALRFTDDAIIADRIVAVDGRDLAADPYRLLLRPGQDLPLDKDLMIVVAALSGSDVVAVGSLDTAIGFVDEKVLSWRIEIAETAPDLSTTSAGCLCQRSGDGILAITPSDDADCDSDPDALDCDSDNANIGHHMSEVCQNGIDDNCNDTIDEQLDGDGDGFLNCEECDDSNADIYPGAPEICDGYDNDCSDATPRYTDQPIPCYARDAELCWIGERECDDYDPAIGGWKDQCIPLGNDPHDEAAPSLCDAFDDCVQGADYQDGFECAGRIFTVFSCELLIKKDSNQATYSVCPNRFFLGEGIPPLEMCRWIMIGGTEQQGYTAGLRDINDLLDFGGVLDTCQGLARVYETFATPPELPVPGTIDLWSRVSGVPADLIRIQLMPRVIDDPNFLCPFNGLSCTAAAP